MKSESERGPYPPGWMEMMVEKADFKAAFDALEGYPHFHSESLRGKIRSIQLRTQEAWEHFQKAEELSKSYEESAQKRIFLFYLSIYRVENAYIEEARDPEEKTSERTDFEMQRFLDTKCPELVIAQQLQINFLGYYQLLRGQYQEALLTFKALMEESQTRFEDQQVAFFCAAAAACKELGLEEDAKKHYENAALAVNSLSQLYKIGLFCARLYTLMMHWEKHKEAEEWLQRLEKLPCPEDSRQCFIERARLFTVASSQRRGIFIS